MRVEETGVVEPKFNILTEPIFSRACKTFVGAAERSRKAGVGIKKHKAPEITFSVEKDLLADPEHSITDVNGLQKRLCYYIVTRFGVRGYLELHGMFDVDFSLQSDNNGEYVAYHERVSKNWGCSVTKFDNDHFHPPVWTYEEDFVLTYKCYLMHLPAKENKEPRNFFLQAIVRPRGPVWYQKVPVGQGKIRSWLNTMGSLVNEAAISNKSGRVTTISRMSLAGVPPDVGMLVTGHQTLDAYKKYDITKELQVNACMSILANPFNSDGTLRTYKQVLSEEIAKKRSGCIKKDHVDVVEKECVGDVSNTAAMDSHLNVENGPPISTEGLAANLSIPAGGVSSNVDVENTKESNQLDCSATKGNELVCNAENVDKQIAQRPVDYFSYYEDIDDCFCDLVENLHPQMKKTKIEKCSTNNSGAQSFMGSSNANCTFISITITDPQLLPNVLERACSNGVTNCQ